MAELSLYFPQSNQNFFVEDEIVIAGRSLKTCQLPLRSYFAKGDHSLISRKHFKIMLEQSRSGWERADKFFIVDLDSRNGTQVNGKALRRDRPRALHHGDLIKVAGEDHFLIKVIIDDGPTDLQDAKSGISFDYERSLFMVDGNPIPDDYLAPRDKELLHYLYQNAGEVCLDDELIRDVWLSAEVQNNAVAVAIKRLRQKLKRLSAGAEDYIERVARQGYRLVT